MKNYIGGARQRGRGRARPEPPQAAQGGSAASPQAAQGGSAASPQAAQGGSAASPRCTFVLRSKTKDARPSRRFRRGGCGGAATAAEPRRGEQQVGKGGVWYTSGNLKAAGCAACKACEKFCNFPLGILLLLRCLTWLQRCQIQYS